MIRFTLGCECGHAFESWFPSGEAYDEQAARGLVSCPVCDSQRVGKALMAPAVARRDSGVRATASASDQTLPPQLPEAPVPMIAEPERRLRALLRAVRDQVTRSADNVGPRFADEARAMHYGDTPTRAIYGEASVGEARALVEEGIAVAPLPPAPDDRN